MADHEHVVTSLMNLQAKINQKKPGAGDTLVDQLHGTGTADGLDTIRLLDAIIDSTQPK